MIIKPFNIEDNNPLDISPADLPGATEEPVVETPSEEIVSPLSTDPTEPVTPLSTESNTLESLLEVEEPSKETPAEEPIKDKIDYKSIVDYLIEEELFFDFEGREDLDLNEQSFADLLKEQVKYIASKTVEEEKQSFGSTASQLLDYLKNGGSVEQFTKNYSQEVDITSIDLDNSKNQERVIRDYYEAIGWEDAKINKYITRLKDEGDDEFKQESQECQAKLVKEIQAEREQILKEQEDANLERKQYIETFNKKTKEAIYKELEISDKEKKELENYLYKHTVKDEQGRTYSDFYKDFVSIQKDPVKYAKLVSIVKNFDKVETKEKVENQANKKVFNFLKTSSANQLSSTVGVEPEKRSQKGKIQPLKFI